MANLHMKVVAAILLGFAASAAAADEPAACFVEQNFYYPKEGMAEQALAVRIKGEEVREQLGLPVGRLMVVEKATSGHPSSGNVVPLGMSYITSLTEYANEGEAASAQQALAASEAYLAVRNEMGSLLRHFETATWRPVRGGCKGAAK